MTNRPIPVLVTAVGGRSVGHQVLHALKQAASDYRIVATDMEPFSFGLYLADQSYIVPKATAPDYLEAVLRVIAREGIRVLLPGSEAEIRVLAGARERLAAAGCSLIAADQAVIERCVDKGHLYRWLDENGFGVPRSVRGLAWPELVAAVGFPIIAKPAVGGSGSRDVAILASADEVEQYLKDTGQHPELVVFQEYVGTAESEYTAGVLVSKSGEIIDSIIIHRQLIGLSQGASRTIDGRRYALSTGYSQGYVVRHPPLQAFCEALALRLGVRGPLNIQCRLAGEAIKVLEVHPRFSGTTSLRADVGFNEPDALIRDVLSDTPIGRLDYRDDVAVIRAFQSVVVPRAVLASLPRA